MTLIGITERMERPDSYGDIAYRQLKELILSGQIQPGTPINEREFARSLNMSRTPLRDAIKRLETERWLEANGNVRVVSRLTWRDLKDLMEVRVKIEEMAIELALPKIEEKDLTALQLLQHEISEKRVHVNTEYYDAMKADADFHRYITNLTGNKILISV